jgi:hypothetical protein
MKKPIRPSDIVGYTFLIANSSKEEKARQQPYERYQLPEKTSY